MMQIRLFLAAAAVLFSAPASAQDRAPESTLDLSALARALNPGGPAWSGRAAFPAAPGAIGRLYPVAHGVGGVISEIDVAPTRVARLNEAVAITNVEHGDLMLPAGTILVARNGSQIEVRPGAPQAVLTDNGPLQWCAPDSLPAPVCISMLGEGQAEYREQTTSNARIWRGAPPVFTQEQTSFDPPITWQLVIAAIDPQRGVSIESRFGRGQHRIRDRGFGLLPFGSVVRSSESLPGQPGFRVERGDAGRVVIAPE